METTKILSTMNLEVSLLFRFKIHLTFLSNPAPAPVPRGALAYAGREVFDQGLLPLAHLYTLQGLPGLFFRALQLGAEVSRIFQPDVNLEINSEEKEGDWVYVEGVEEDSEDELSD